MINRSIKLIISLALTLLSVACGSAPQISGVVRDGRSGHVIPRVKVRTIPNTVPVLTTKQGRFLIDRQINRGNTGFEPIE